MNNDLQPNALQSQILAAQDEINDAQTTAAQKSAHQARRGISSQLSAVIAVVSFVGLLIWQRDQLRWLVGPSPQTMRADLETLMAQAVQDVNAYHGRTGNWPERLPNPALAAVVNYQYHGNAHYTLSAQHGPITLEQHY